MVKIIKKCFFGLLTALVNGSNHTKCMSLSHQRFIIQSTIINLYTNDYSQEFHYYPLDRYVRSCDTQSDSSNKVCIPNKTDPKFKGAQHDYRNKWFENFNKAYIMRM